MDRCGAGPFITPALRTDWSLQGQSGAQVAQLVEHAIENRSVGGSIHAWATTLFSQIVASV